MSRRRRKHLIEVFRDPARIGSPGSDSSKCSGCGSRSSCNEVTESLDEWLKRIPLKYDESVRLRIVDSSTKSSMSKNIDTLNRMLEEKREEMRVNSENFAIFMAQKAPLIAIDGLLFFTGDVPSDEKLQRAMEITDKLAAGSLD